MAGTCPKCGELHPCAHTRTSAVLAPERVATSPSASAGKGAHWRDEVASRVRRHRARRRPGADASLELDFQTQPPLIIATGPYDPALQSEPASAMNTAMETDAMAAHPGQALPWREGDPAEPPAARRRKIIFFPGPLTLAPETDPAADEPRILFDAPEPEQISLIPSFADIRLDEAPEDESRGDEFDFPEMPASLRRRLESGLVDAGIVLLALIVFAGCFAAALSGMAAIVPRSRPALLCALAACAMLAMLFQYIFLVYGRRTPGMGAASLELSAWDGRKPSRAARRWRALAATLSGLSLGLGFAWAVVDEHTLGWHDRISQTYLKEGN